MLQRADGDEHARTRHAIQAALDHALALGDEVTVIDLSRILHGMRPDAVARVSDWNN